MTLRKPWPMKRGAWHLFKRTPSGKYAATLKKNITANAIDFVLEEESGAVKIKDNAHVVIGGMIATKTIKFTKYNQAMAFITIEDLTGTVEVIIFREITSATRDIYRTMLKYLLSDMRQSRMSRTAR